MKIRKMTVLIIAMITACILSAACNAGSSKTDGDWVEKALEDNKDQYAYSQTLDINGDGTNVLLLSNEPGDFFTEEAKVVLLSQQDGKVKELQDFSYAGGCKLFLNQDKHRLTWMTRLSGEQQAYVYEFSNGALKEETVLEYYAQNHDPNGVNKEDTYYINGKKVDEAEFTQVYDTFLADDMALTLQEF